MECVLDENFHGWKIRWTGTRPAPGNGGGGYEFGYLSYLIAYEPGRGKKGGLIAIARPHAVPFIAVIQDAEPIPRVEGDLWSEEDIRSDLGYARRPGRWDMTKHHVAAPSGWFEPMADAYEALQLHILGAAVNEPMIERGRKERDGLQAVYQAKDYASNALKALKAKIADVERTLAEQREQREWRWAEDHPRNPANARSPLGMMAGLVHHEAIGLRSHGTGGVATVTARDPGFVALVNRHGSESSDCAWAMCMDGRSDCHINRETGRPYPHRPRVISTMAEAERVGACCPCTCGADARAMADSMKAGEQRRWFPEAFAEAVQLGRKKPWRHAPVVEQPLKARCILCGHEEETILPADCQWCGDAEEMAYGYDVAEEIDTGRRWEPEPTVPLVTNLGRFGVPDLFQYAEAA